MAKENRKPDTASLSLTMKSGPAGLPERISLFSPLLLQGFTVRARVGCTIRELLCDQFGLSPEYLKQRITTIFLNSKAIDDPETSRVADGATLALSAAMPGLVGATMRCGGYYAAMRSGISHREAVEEHEENSGEIRIKLFNLLTAELGPGFLRRGVMISAADLRDFLAGQGPDFWAGCGAVLLDGRPVEAGLLKSGTLLAEKDEPVTLSVTFEE